MVAENPSNSPAEEFEWARNLFESSVEKWYLEHQKTPKGVDEWKQLFANPEFLQAYSMLAKSTDSTHMESSNLFWALRGPIGQSYLSPLLFLAQSSRISCETVSRIQNILEPFVIQRLYISPEPKNFSELSDDEIWKYFPTLIERFPQYRNILLAKFSSHFQNTFGSDLSTEISEKDYFIAWQSLNTLSIYDPDLVLELLFSLKFKTFLRFDVSFLKAIRRRENNETTINLPDNFLSELRQNFASLPSDFLIFLNSYFPKLVIEIIAESNIAKSNNSELEPGQMTLDFAKINFMKAIAYCDLSKLSSKEKSLIFDIFKSGKLNFSTLYPDIKSKLIQHFPKKFL